MKSWLKGGIIALTLLIISYIMGIILYVLNLRKLGNIISVFSTDLTSLVMKFIIIIIPQKNYFIWRVEMILTYIISLIIIFCIGAIIGLIIEKLKSKEISKITKMVFGGIGGFLIGIILAEFISGILNLLIFKCEQYHTIELLNNCLKSFYFSWLILTIIFVIIGIFIGYLSNFSNKK